MPKHSLDLFIAVLACYRLAQFLSLDDGPGFVFKRLRDWSLTQQTRRGGASLIELLECPYCQGVWAAAPLALWCVVPCNDLIDWAVMVLAIAGGQAFLQTLGDRENEQRDGRHI